MRFLSFVFASALRLLLSLVDRADEIRAPRTNLKRTREDVSFSPLLSLSTLFSDTQRIKTVANIRSIILFMNPNDCSLFQR